ncbi:MAG: hypothetical protein JXK93_01050 [Sphaerochaetaceae bacterium]|nr:hypothetical protein [Sphaerochaetaceae bacterium]
MKTSYRLRILALYLFIFIQFVSIHAVTTQDVSLAMKSVVISTAVVRGGSLIWPVLEFEEASFEQEGSGSSFVLQVDKADIGSMRETFLLADPPEARPMGFFEMLLQSVNSLFPDYFMIREYLERQHLLPGDIVLSGEMVAQRRGDVPFRYEGTGTFEVGGTRVSESFVLDFSFMIPLEGNSMGSIIPLRVVADGKDFITEARRIFRVNVN